MGKRKIKDDSWIFQLKELGQWQCRFRSWGKIAETGVRWGKRPLLWILSLRRLSDIQAEC